MADRKPIPKKTRFEVFKRDEFTCQYCGAKAPDAILHIDHIVPVAEGGTNDILNLVTACRDCNLGKGKRMLDDDSAMQVAQDRMEEMEARREQLQMLYEWNKTIIELQNDEVESVNVLIKQMTGYGFNEIGAQDIRKLISQFGVGTVIDSTRIAFTQYRSGTDDEWAYAFKKIGAICYNRTHKRCHQCKDCASRIDKYTVECKTYGGVDVKDAEKCPNYESMFGGDAR